MRPGHWLFIFRVPLRLRSWFRRTQADQELDQRYAAEAQISSLTVAETPHQPLRMRAPIHP